MENEQPVYLPVGSEVSAKFKGAFCEARITNLVKLVKIKVQLRNSLIIVVDETAIQSGRLEINQIVEVIYMKQIHRGQIICIKDCSSYTVTFNDGDERILKRTQLCQKSAKHFKEAETLDKLPLYHPDKRCKKKKEAEKKLVSPNSQSPRHFRSSSVTPLKGIASTRSATRAIAQLQFEETERSASAAADCSCISNLPAKASSLSPHRTTNSDLESEELFQQQSTSTAAGAVVEKQKDDVLDQYPHGTPVIVSSLTPPKLAAQIQLGLVVSVAEFKMQCKHYPETLQLQFNNTIPVRSFQDGKYFITYSECLQKFDADVMHGLIDFGALGLKVAFERAKKYVLRGLLPKSWIVNAPVVGLTKKKIKKSEKLSDSSSSEEEDDSEYNEKRDLCVAHFYKFQDESGNQLNKVPLLGGKEIDIYRFYDVVSRMGGHKRVTQETGWRKVLRKLRLEDTGVSPTTVKNTYIRYFEKFEAFMKNLGYSSLTVSSSTPSTNSRTTRIIRGYNPTEKKTKPKERGSLDRGQSISKERSDSVLKSRSGSISSIKAASPAMTSSIRSNEQLQKHHHFGKLSPESAFLNNDDTNTATPQEQTESHKKITISEKSIENMEPLEKKRKYSQETSAECQPLLEGSSTSKKEPHESDKNQLSQKKPQGTRGRKPKFPREQRTKSPTGHQAVLEDIGYTNAHIFTRFYQGQNVHARHHLRFYDARVIMVKQPTLSEIATSLCDAFDLSIISRQISQNLTDLSFKNMGNELKDALHDIMMSTKIFVHYLGWNSRYDEWLMLHKIRVDEKDEKSSSTALGQLIPGQLPAELVTVAMDWCRSPEGIASLATLPGAQSLEQRPRRLSSATLSKTNSNFVRKCNEVIPCKELNKTSESQTTHQAVTTNIVPLEMELSSSIANCVYSAPPLPAKTKDHQQPNGLSDRAFCSSSPSSSPHNFISPLSDDQTSSLSLTIKTDSADNSPASITAPYSDFVKTSLASEYTKCSASFSSSNILTSSRPIAYVNSKTPNLPVTIPKEETVKMQALFTRSEMPNLVSQAEIIIFENPPREYCSLNVKVCHERKVIVFQQQATVPRPETVSLELSENIKTTLIAEEPKNIALQQQVQNVNNKKRVAGIGPMSSPAKILKQTNKTTARGTGGKTSTDATTETSEDEEGSDGSHNISIQSLKHRVLQRMEEKHLFDNYSFVGLSELDDELANCVGDPDKQVRLIEGRMRELREIYHKYKGKLMDLEKAHKKWQRHEKKSARKMAIDK